MLLFACCVCQRQPQLQSSQTLQESQDPQNKLLDKSQIQSQNNNNNNNCTINPQFLMLDCCHSMMCQDCYQTGSSCRSCNEANQSLKFIECNKNHLLNELLNTYASFPSYETQGQNAGDGCCERCIANIANHRCTTCNVNLCEDCNHTIHSIGSYATHLVKLLDLEAVREVHPQLRFLHELEHCKVHNAKIEYFSTVGNVYGCEQCTQDQPNSTFAKLSLPSFTLSQKKYDLEKEQITAQSFLQTILDKNNSLVQNEIQTQKNSKILEISQSFDKLIKLIKLKQQEIIEQVEQSYLNKIDEARQSQLQIKQRKEILDRNYTLLKTLLNVVPENILGQEETLFKKIQSTNIQIIEDLDRNFGINKTKQINLGYICADTLQRIEDTIQSLQLLESYNIEIDSVSNVTKDLLAKQSSEDDKSTIDMPRQIDNSSMKSGHTSMSNRSNLNSTKKNPTQTNVKQYKHQSKPSNFDKQLNQSQSQSLRNVIYNTGNTVDTTRNPTNQPGKPIMTLDISQPQILKASHGHGGFLSSQASHRNEENKTERSTSNGQPVYQQMTLSQLQKQRSEHKNFKPLQTNTSLTRKQNGSSHNHSMSNSAQLQNRKQSIDNAISPNTKNFNMMNTFNQAMNQTSREHSSNYRKQLMFSTQQSNSMMNQSTTNPSIFQSEYDNFMQQQEEHQSVIDSNPLSKRMLTHIAQTSTAIQVAWSHPTNISKSANKIQLQYILQYGIGVKVNNQEQFRQIYKGKAHKCIITDLMPRTTYRFRVAPIIISQSSDQTEPVIEQGEWSEICNIQTRDNQNFDIQNLSNPCATIVSKGKRRWINFEKTGTMLTSYGYSFGEHLWQIKISYNQNLGPTLTHPLQSISNTSNTMSNHHPQVTDLSGIMIVGVINKRFSNSKMIGSVVNYSQGKGNIRVRILLDANKKRLIVFTPSNPQGEVFTDLPKDGLYFPAIQNKSKLQRNCLKVEYKFELAIPKDKTQIALQNSYSSDEENHDDEEFNSGGEEEMMLQEQRFMKEQSERPLLVNNE